MQDQPFDLATALAEAADAINRPTSLGDTLDAIVEATLASVPGFTDVGISIRHRGGRIETKSGTGRLVWELDTIQYDLDEGPCVDAIRAGEMVVVEDVRHEQRWPRYVAAAARTGLRSQIGLGLYDDGRTLGGLNLYSTIAEGVSDQAVQAAQLFARHATIALDKAQSSHHLNEALLSRKVIGQAVGIVMERFQIDEDRALQFIVRASSTSNIKLRDVAAELVDTSNERARRKRD
jgi:GAF domain-containing protein